MFAVMKTGGKQYRVQSGDILRIEKLSASAGETVRFDHVLMIGGDTMMIGNPVIDGAAVTAEVVEQVKADKVVTFVKRRRKHSSKRTRGHRQKLTEVRILDILPDGSAAPLARTAEPEVAEAEAEAPAAEVQDAAAPQPEEAQAAPDPQAEAPVEAAPEAPAIDADGAGEDDSKPKE